MKRLYQLTLVFCVLVTTACSTEHLAQGIYEGSQNRNQSLRTPQERATDPLSPQSYRDYEKERERLKNGARGGS